MKKRTWLSLSTAVLALGLVSAGTVKKVHTIGDSTMAQYDPNSTVTRGWAQYLQQFFNGVEVNNRGKGGASTRAFYESEALWGSTKSQMNAGDYVIIQFAHNDEKNGGVDGQALVDYYTSIGDTESAAATDNRGTQPTGAYKQYLIKFVNETKMAGCTPLIAGPICRKYFSGSKIKRNGRHDLGDSFSKLTANGVVTGQSVPADDHSMDYAYQAKQVADSMGVAYIDLTTATQELFEKYGDAKTSTYFFDGQGGTHLNETGATIVARMCAQKMKEQNVLADNIVITSELNVSTDSLDLGNGYKGQTLTKSFDIKGFDLTPESGDITINATGGLYVSTDQTNWATSVTAHYDATMALSTVYVKADITNDDAQIAGDVTVTLGSTTKTVKVTGSVVKVAPAEGQSDITATWTLGDGLNSSMNAEMSAQGMTSATSMSLGSKLTPYSPGTPNLTNESYYRVQPVDSNVGAEDEDNCVTFTLVPKRGLAYVPTNFSFKASKFGTGGGKYNIYACVGDNKVQLASGITPNRSNSSSSDATLNYSQFSYDISNLVTVGEPVLVKIYVMSLANNKQHGFRDVVLTGNFSGTAEEVPSYTLNVSNPTPAAGTVSVLPAGTVFDEGTSVTISATENFGYHFLGWDDADGNTVSENNPYTFNIDHSMQLHAVYEKATVYNLNVTPTNGAASYMVTYEPEGNVVDGVHQYEVGTEVKLTATNNRIFTFIGWEDNSTTATRTVKMDADKNLTADYSAADYIVAWDFYNDQPGTERAADFKSDTENAGLLSLHNLEGATNSWLSRGHNNGPEYNVYGARIWKNLTEKLFFEISFSTKGYKNVTVGCNLGNNYNSYTTYYEQVSLDGKDYETVGTYTLPNRGWAGSQDITLPAKYADQNKVYVRWYPDYNSDLIGVSSDYDGLTIGEIYVFGESDVADDNVAPVLVTTNPGQNATGVSATGSIILTFNEKIKAGTGDATLDGEVLIPVITGKTAVFKYGPLKYNRNYTFTLPAGAITDRSGNTFSGTIISFTTMERTQPEARLFDAVVAADGTGDYTSVLDAIAAAPENRNAPWLIFIKKGTYTGHHVIPSTKPYIHLIGQDKSLVTISDTRKSGGENAYGIAEGATMDIESDNIFIEGVDLINAYGVEANTGPQALALCSNGDKLILNNMHLRSYQDTWFTGGTTGHRAFCYNSLIEGAVDFIYSTGDVMFLNDTLYITRDKGGYIVAPSHDKSTKWGYVFLNNVITAPGEPSKTSVWLGRPWHGYPKTVFINTKAEVTIPATGWYETMGGLPALWAEYNTMDANGNPVDLSNRRTQYYKTENGEKVYGYSETAVLTAEQAAQYTVKNVCSGDDAWDPEIMCEACDAPQPKYANSTLTWDAVPYAICYVVTKDNEVIGFTKEPTFETTGNGIYKVQAANEYGSLSKAATVSVTATATGVDTVASVSGKTVKAIYNIDGKQTNKRTAGVNVVKYTDGSAVKVVK